MKFLKFITTFLILASCLQAAVPRTHIVGTLYHPNGSVPTNASVNIKPTGPFTVNDTVSGASLKHPITAPPAGQTLTISNTASIDLYIVPNYGSGNDPNYTYYNVTVNTNLGSYKQIWQIGTSGSDVRLADVIVSQPAQTTQNVVPQSGGTYLGTVTFPQIVLNPQAEPSSNTTGTLYYDLTDNQAYIWNGTQFVSLGGEGAGGTVVHDSTLDGSGTSGDPLSVDVTALSHNSLSGLTSGDPHTQYLLHSGSRALTGNLDFNGNQALDFVLEKTTEDTRNVTGNIWYETDNQSVLFSRGYETIDVMNLAQHTGSISWSAIDNPNHADTHSTTGSDTLSGYYLPTGNVTLTGYINFDYNAAKSILIDPVSVDPSSPIEGQMWYNTGDGRMKYRTSGSNIVLNEVSRDDIADFHHAEDHYPGEDDDISSVYALRDAGDFTDDVLFNNNEIKEFRIENLASNPSPGNAGRLFWNTTLSRFQQDSGIAITDLGVGGSSILTEAPLYGTGLAGAPVGIDLAATNHNALANLTTGNPHTQYILASGATPLTGNWSLGGTYRISGSADPIDAQDLVTKAYSESNFLGKTGGTVTGNTTLSGYSLINFVVDPVLEDPTDNVTGRMWFNTTDRKIRWYDGLQVRTTNNVSKSDVSDFEHYTTHAPGAGDDISGYYAKLTGPTFTGNVTVSNNQLIQARLENWSVNPAAGNVGRIGFNTALGKVQIDNGVGVGDLTASAALEFLQDSSSKGSASRFNGHGLTIGTPVGDTVDVTVTGLVTANTTATVVSDAGMSMGTYTDSDVIRYWKVLKKTTVNSASFTSLSMKTDGTGFLYTTNDTTHAYEITVVGRGTAGTNDNKSAHYKFSVTVDNTAGTVAIVNTSLPTTVSEEIAAWDCQVVANDTNDLLDIQVKGDAASTVSWRAMVDEVIAR